MERPNQLANAFGLGAWVEQAVLAVRRRDQPWAAAVHRAVKRAVRYEVPTPPRLAALMGTLRASLSFATTFAARAAIHQPIFRSQCEHCGDQLLLQGGIPYVHGNLKIRIGNGCMINGKTSLAAGNLIDRPVLSIGDRTNISYGTIISVAKRVEIGNGVRIADSCYISDNPGHPLDAADRRAGRPVTADQVKPVKIGDDVWLGTRVIVLPGVEIGDGAIVGSGSVVTRSIPSGCVAVGNPARVVRRLEPVLEREECA